MKIPKLSLFSSTAPHHARGGLVPYGSVVWKISIVFLILFFAGVITFDVYIFISRVWVLDQEFVPPDSAPAALQTIDKKYLKKMQEFIAEREAVYQSTNTTPRVPNLFGQR